MLTASAIPFLLTLSTASAETVAVCTNDGVGFYDGNVGCLYTLESYDVTCSPDGMSEVVLDDTYSSGVKPYVGHAYCSITSSGDDITNTVCEAYGFSQSYESPCTGPCADDEEALENIQEDLDGLEARMDWVLYQAATTPCGEQSELLGDYEGYAQDLATAIAALGNLYVASGSDCQAVLDTQQSAIDAANDAQSLADDLFCDEECDELDEQLAALEEEMQNTDSDRDGMLDAANALSCGDSALEALESDFAEVESKLGQMISDRAVLLDQAAAISCTLTDSPEEIQDILDNPSLDFPECVDCATDVPAAETELSQTASNVEPVLDALGALDCDDPSWSTMESAYLALSEQLFNQVGTLETLADSGCSDAEPLLQDASDMLSKYDWTYTDILAACSD